MEENSRYVSAIDVGTESVRAVQLEIKGDNSLSVIGYGEAKMGGGMRKGTVTNLSGPAEATDRALSEVEKMSGKPVNQAYVSINGTHVVSVKTDGMITISDGQAVSNADLDRLDEAAVSGRMPANRTILDTIPLSYSLDNQGGITNPIGMTGVRLEVKAHVISGLKPSVDALNRAMNMAKIRVLRFVPTAAAAARAVLSEHQMENGVAVIDMGAATTSVAVYDEGDLQYVGVVPAGSNNITKDLAISLQIDTEAAEEIKLRFVTADFPESDKDITVKHGSGDITFSRNEVNEVVRARLEDIFVHVEKELKRAGYAQKLPEGAVLTGGGSRMRSIEKFAKEQLKMAVKLGKIVQPLSGVIESVEKPEFSTAVGLALLMADDGKFNVDRGSDEKKTGGFSLFGLFKKK